MRKLKSMPRDKPVGCNITFHVKDGVKVETWRVKMKTTNNTSKICYSKQEALDYHDPERHYIEYTPAEIMYGVVGDNDNIKKPILDFLEELGKISNDRFAVDTREQKTFNNKENIIEIELFLLEAKPDENNIYRFSEKK